ncbi:cystatin-8-like isoform X2 [Odocoileus virginianus]|uniref:Cystatin-8-like isoform X2 n=1 Tax=Odocoileus virginianus TaxID=9874 RepID=A0ABM4IKJ8_ODOVR
MTRLWGTCQLLLALLVALVALGGSTLVYKDTKKVLRELRNVSSSSSNVKQCLWFAMQEYNKDSKDKFLFQVVKVWQVQMQVLWWQERGQSTRDPVSRNMCTISPASPTHDADDCKLHQGHRRHPSK